ncbi:hypothetical protein CC86DRAFT_427344 [Ophiobolus disseminans]|uniref:Uncharacterized protein n=1 Tax=Ophiobolus disseminans TaxID=1469910 RepID=A0A6A6ZJU2_9PLEO|nr:hypothetical protein CC86DRAFT_427344 [Ophiobolus disseminans]
MRPGDALRLPGEVIYCQVIQSRRRPGAGAREQLRSTAASLSCIGKEATTPVALEMMRPGPGQEPPANRATASGPCVAEAGAMRATTHTEKERPAAGRRWGLRAMASSTSSSTQARPRGTETLPLLAQRRRGSSARSEAAGSVAVPGQRPPWAWLSGDAQNACRDAD